MSAEQLPKNPRAGHKARTPLPRLSQAFPFREPAGRPNSCPAYRKAVGPPPAWDPQAGPLTRYEARERFLRSRLLRGGAPPPLPGLAAELTMTAAGRGRVPPAPFLRSPGRRPGRGAQLLLLRP